jgi:hypothetical protein
VSGDAGRPALQIETDGSALVRVAENGVSPGALELDIEDEGDVTRSERHTLCTFDASAIGESNASLTARRNGRLCVLDHAVDSDASPTSAPEARRSASSRSKRTAASKVA